MNIFIYCKSSKEEKLKKKIVPITIKYLIGLILSMLVLIGSQWLKKSM